MRARSPLLLALALALAGTLALSACSAPGEPGAAGPSSTGPDVAAEPGAASAGPVTIAGITCETSPRQLPAAPNGYTHPTQSFYAATDEDIPTAGDLDHLILSDNAIVVSYGSALPGASIEALEIWSSTTVATVVVPAGADVAGVRAITTDTQLECDGVDTIRLKALADSRTDDAGVEHEDHG